MSSLARIAALARAAWLTVGIAWVLLILLEAAMSFVLWAGNASAPGDYRALADSYQGAAWTSDYYRELEASTKVAWTPYVYWRREGFAGNYIRINGNGIRRTVHEAASPAPPSAPVRIFVFGGSTLWGTGVRDEFTVPSLLARELHNRGVVTEITNFGESGYVSTQEVIALMLELRKQNVPDLVIFYDGVNDLFSAYQQMAAGLPQNEMHRVEEFNLSQPDEWPRALGVTVSSFARSLSLVRAARRALGIVGAPPESDVPTPGQLPARLVGVADAVLKAYVGNMRIVQALGAEYGFRSLFFWQPTIFDKQTLTPYEQSERAKQSTLRPLVFAINDGVRNGQLAGIDPASFVDFSKMFESEEPAIFIDWCHVGERGNNMIALAMAREILTDGVPAPSAFPETR